MLFRSNAGSASKNSLSWTLGAGVEYAVNRNVSLRAEYLYVNLNSLGFTSTCATPTPCNGVGPWTVNHRVSFSGLNVFRAGLNYRF